MRLLEANSYIGYIVMFGFGLLFLMISALISKKLPIEGVDDFLVAGRKVPFALVGAAVTVSWIWTTTIMGSAETGMWFGISGGLNYSWGAVVPFFIFIPLVMHMRKIMPKATTFTEFIEQRFGSKTKNVFFVFGTAVIFYIIVEQGVGAGIAFQSIFGIPYKLASFLAIMIVTLYIAKAGLRGSLFNDLLQFFIIMSILLIVTPIIINHFGMDFIHKGLTDVATNPDNLNYNPDALSLLSSAGLRYGITGMVVAMGQVLLSQGYYSMALATASNRSLFFAYIIGTLLAWAPIPIICSNIFGNVGLAMGLAPGHGIEFTTQVSPYVLKYVFSGAGSILFCVLIFMTAMTTGGNCLAGVQALFTVDLYKAVNKKAASEKQQMKFGRTATIVFGLLAASVATMLQGVSLLRIDIFSGILFAAPCSAFFAGVFWKKPTPTIALVSIFSGLGAGLLAWNLIADQNINWFVGNVLSLVVPAAIILIFSLFTKNDFDFEKLKNYNPGHKINVDEEGESC